MGGNALRPGMHADKILGQHGWKSSAIVSDIIGEFLHDNLPTTMWKLFEC